MEEPSHTNAKQMSRSSVQSIDRAVSILLCFDARRPELGITEIATRTGLSTSTTHRLLMAMQHNRLVRQTTSRCYSLGPLFVQLVGTGAVSTGLREASMAAMTQLRDETNESVGLHELSPSGERTVIDQVESYQPLRRTYTELGMPIELPYGAPGKVLLAFLPPALRDAILEEPLRAVTPSSITDPETLREQLVEIRRSYIALSYSERTPGIRTVASPIFDHAGAVIGCMSLSAPEVRMPQERMLSLGPLVRDASWKASTLLGATTDSVRATADDSAESQESLLSPEDAR